MVVNIAQALASSQLTAQDAPALRQVWETIGPDSCPCFYNFHLHTIYSDGQLKPEDLIKQALTIGIKGLAITDHHTIGGYLVAQGWLIWRCRKMLHVFRCYGRDMIAEQILT